MFLCSQRQITPFYSLEASSKLSPLWFYRDMRCRTVIIVDFSAFETLLKTAHMPFYNFQIESAHHTQEVKEAIREARDCVEADREAGWWLLLTLLLFKCNRSCERSLTFHSFRRKFTTTTSRAETSRERRFLTRWRQIETEEGDYCGCYCLLKGHYAKCYRPTVCSLWSHSAAQHCACVCMILRAKLCVGQCVCWCGSRRYLPVS